MNGGRLGPRQLPYNIPVQAIGTDFEVSPGDFSIARLAIDNPSQCWLYLSQINTYIPPQTLSRIVSVNPTQTRVLVSFVNAPTGGVPSVATGDPIQVIAYDTDAPDVAGTDFGLLPAVIDLTAEIQTLIDSIDNLRGGWGSGVIGANSLEFLNVSVADGMSNVLLSVASGFRAVLTSLSVSWVMDYIGQWPRGFIETSVSLAGGDSLALPVLTPENRNSPFYNWPPGTIVGADGEDIIARANARGSDSEAQAIYFVLGYYLIPA